MAVNSLAEIRGIFGEITQSTDWDINGLMVWGYYFMDPDPDRLADAGSILEDDGYIVVEIYESEGESLFWLCLIREEVHTPESLYERQQVLVDFAAVRGLAGFDGVSVGPIEPA